MEIVPALALLALRTNTRVFQHESVPRILEMVLADGLRPYDRAVRLDSKDSYPAREYCLQYDETDLDFVQRLVEEEGISYGFEHDGPVEVLVLRDRNGAHGEVETLDGHAVPYTADDRLIGTSRADRRLSPDPPDDYDILRAPRLRLDAAARDAARPQNFRRARTRRRAGLLRTLPFAHDHHYDQAIRKYRAHDGTRQARVRAELHARDSRTASGAGRVIGFAPGLRFTLSGHPNLGADGAYLLTRVVHVSEPLPGLQGASQRDPYHNRFECIPAEVPFRPTRAVPKPRIHSIQTAVVVGPAGEEIHTDEHGRIKVEFHWDRQGMGNERSSCWISLPQEA